MKRVDWYAYSIHNVGFLIVSVLMLWSGCGGLTLLLVPTYNGVFWFVWWCRRER